MANRDGTNQFGGFSREPPYGDVKRQTQLSREAPMSGAQIATHATETPRRNKRRAQRGNAPEAQAPAAATGPPVSPEAEVLAIGQQIATDPEASDLLRQIVGQG